MGKLLQKYSDEMHGKQEAKTGVKKVVSAPADSKDPLARYQDAMKNKQSIEIKFELSEADGSLVARDSAGVKIVYDGDVVRRDMPYFEEANKASFIGVDFVVKIESIDEAAAIVYVKSAYSTSQATKTKLIREILSECDGEEMLVLPGRIITVSEKRALVDLLGKGILGIISVDNWQKGYVRHLQKTIHKGEVYDFVVQKPLPQKDRRKRSLAFRLTRVPITEDPWQLLKKNNPGLAVDSIITVKCISKPAGKSYWWGMSPMVEGIEIMGDYSNAITRPFVGATYKCRITKFDPDNQKFQVVPFDVIDTPGASKEAIRFISSRPKSSNKNSRKK